MSDNNLLSDVTIWTNNFLDGKYCVPYEFNTIEIKYIWNILQSTQENENTLNLRGYMYTYGFGVDRNIIKAINYFKSSAKYGNSDAMNNLGDIYVSPRGISRNIPKAIKYYKKSIKLHNINAIEKLAKLYETCDACKNIKLAIKYYKMASSFRNIYSIERLAQIYFLDFGSVSKYIKYNKHAAESGSVSAMRKLAQLFSDCVEYNDIYSAIKYYKMAVALGDKLSESQLSEIYTTHDSIGNIHDDITRYEKYILQHIAPTLLTKYENDSIPKCKLAYKIRKILSSKTHKTITSYDINILNRIADAYMADTEYYNVNEAIKYYEISSRDKNLYATFRLATIYYHTYLHRDIHNAIEYYKQTVELCVPYANMEYEDGNDYFGLIKGISLYRLSHIYIQNTPIQNIGESYNYLKLLFNDSKIMNVGWQLGFRAVLKDIYKNQLKLKQYFISDNKSTDAIFKLIHELITNMSLCETTHDDILYDIYEEYQTLENYANKNLINAVRDMLCDKLGFYFIIPPQ